MSEIPPSEPDRTEEETMVAPLPTEGGSILPQSATPVRETIGDYEVLAKLGAGGMGAVYRAHQTSLGRTVALKILPAHLIEDEDSVARFQREARVAAGLSHANLVHVYAAGEAAGCHFIAMELIEGEDLGRRLKRDGALPAPEALRITAEVARGLDHAWRTAHLIHRDIKPANIFLAANGAVKVGDLGLAKSTLGNTSGLTQTGTMMGTPHYISPEQARADKEIDFRADIYSLGCTLYHMLTGQVPYRGTDAITIIRQHLDAPLPAILKVWPQCPVPLARLVGKMLKKSRHERHGSYPELLAQIETVLAQVDPTRFSPQVSPLPTATDSDTSEVDIAGQTPRATPARASRAVAAQPPATRSRSKLPLYCGIGAGILLLVLGGVFFLLPREEKLSKAELYAQQKEEEARNRGATVEPVSPASPTAIAAPSSPLPEQTDDDPSPKDRKLKVARRRFLGMFDPGESAASAPAEPWQDALRDPAYYTLREGTERNADGVSVNFSGGLWLAPGFGPKRDGALRFRAKYGEGVPQLRLRQNSQGESYQLHCGHDRAVIGRWDQAQRQYVALREFVFETPLQAGQEYTLELRAVGPTLTAAFNDRTLGSITDPAIASGMWGIGASSRQPAQVRSLDVLDLDASAASANSPASVTPSAAIKAAPFVN